MKKPKKKNPIKIVRIICLLKYLLSLNWYISKGRENTRGASVKTSQTRSVTKNDFSLPGCSETPIIIWEGKAVTDNFI